MRLVICLMLVGVVVVLALRSHGHERSCFDSQDVRSPVMRFAPVRDAQGRVWWTSEWNVACPGDAPHFVRAYGAAP